MRFHIYLIHYANQPVPYDLYASIQISHILTHLALCVNSVLNVKVLVGAFKQVKALVWAFSMIVKSS